MRDVIILDRALVESMGLNKAIIYSELLEELRLHKANRTLPEDRYFPMQVAKLRLRTSLSEYQQRKAIKELINEKIVRCELRGIPQIRYFTILKFL